eukprot:7038588-Pyramimonas_sp.AAC.1
MFTTRVRSRGDKPESAAYMYTLSSSGGLIASMAELNDNWIVAGHQPGGVSAWQLCPAGTPESEDLWDGEVLGLEH